MSDHLKCRALVCLLCMRKAKSPVQISGQVLQRIQKHVLSNYDITEIFLPSVICVHCHILLAKFDNGDSVKLPTLFDFSSLQQYRSTRQRSSEPCSCQICQTAKFNPIGKTKEENPQTPLGRPQLPKTKETPPSPGPLVLCKRCFGIYGKGYKHECKLTYRADNLEKTLSIPSGVKQKIAVSAIKEGIKTSNSNEAILKTGGRPLRVSPNISKDPPKPIFKFDDMKSLMTKRNMSQAAAGDLCSSIRTTFGRKSVEPAMREKLTEQNQLLDHYFKLTTLKFISKSSNGHNVEIERPAVLVRDMDEFVQDMIKERSYNPATTMVKLGMDGGGGFFKLTLNIIDQENTINSPARKSARRLFSSGAAAEACKDSSVKRLFIIGLIPDIPENYENMEIIFNELKIHQVKFIIATDLKLANIILGLSAHGAVHSCSWCEANSREWSKGGNLRSLGRIRECFQRFCNSGANLKNAQHFLNCIHLPLLLLDDTTLVLDIIPPPELHLLLGAFNHLYDGLEEDWKGASEWTKKCNVQKVAWRGRDGKGHFQGNECRKLLKNLDLLDGMTNLPQKKFVRALRALNKVVTGCFGEVLSQTYLSDIEEFKTAFLDTQLSVTPKLHAIFTHVPQFCQKENHGLGLYSEQAGESAHHDFTVFWERYKVPHQHQQFGERLAKAVVAYNSRHI